MSETLNTFSCQNECCSFKIIPYTATPPSRRKKYRKAGVFIHDPEEQRVLLVQSRGHLWGLPKGTLNMGESDRECAVREVKEETGLTLTYDDFTRAIKIRNRAVYFYTEMNTCEVNVQTDDHENDANGVAWVKIDCLEQCIYDGHIKINQHCRIAFRRFLNMDLPYSSYTEVRRNSRRRNVP